MKSITFGALCLLWALGSHASANERVEVKENQLFIDGKNQPQLFGAEVQYFRLRGAYGPNVPRQTVIDLWNRVLDRVVEAKMNAVSFYIPWDFHEYARGKFDFTGTVDADGDGNPDYPSRDVVTFIKLVIEHKISRIMIRPGPYINAEWGFLGFGAIPEWYHNDFSDSHMESADGQKTKLYDYLNPNFLSATKSWFEALYNQVLKPYIGPGQPIVFLQLDNETNYQWQSLYNQDYSSAVLTRYQHFLQKNYGDLSELNRAHRRSWRRWNEIMPPTAPKENIAEDQDWYRFNDRTLFNYLHQIRKLWEGLGVREPQVMFTLAESYNAPENGLLPHYVYRNSPHKTGLMTVNLYPKTFETPDHALLNSPFKADLDVKSAQEANSYYYGTPQEWAMGPEIQAGWWRGIDVTPEARLQTYLTVLGHGLKSFFVYYFNEGQNWQVDWAHGAITDLFNNLRQELGYEKTATPELPNEFWRELQRRSDKNVLIGFDARKNIQGDLTKDQTLYFDSPLDPNGQPRAHFDQLRQLGEKFIEPYGDFLARSQEVVDPVAILRDSEESLPSPNIHINSLLAASEWTGGLLGYLMNAGVNPRVLHSEISWPTSLNFQKILFHIDTEMNSAPTLAFVQSSLNQGGHLVNFLGEDVPRTLGLKFQSSFVNQNDTFALKFYLDSKGQLTDKNQTPTTPFEISASGPLFKYKLAPLKDWTCKGILYFHSDPVGYRCQKGKNIFYQIGALIFKDFNSSDYAHLKSGSALKEFMTSLLNEAQVKPQIILKGTSQTVAFARKDPQHKLLWLTLKTGKPQIQQIQIQIDPQLLKASLINAKELRVSDLLDQTSQNITVSEVSRGELNVFLRSNGSKVLVIETAATGSNKH